MLLKKINGEPGFSCAHNRKYGKSFVVEGSLAELGKCNFSYFPLKVPPVLMWTVFFRVKEKTNLSFSISYSLGS